ncbi:MAG: rhomboid family intramembrane serine protease [Sphingobacteriales bacterium]|nr:MAG: rhomboid family intramembrane serine protease [Sphingobacteriales bacterium]
MTTTVNPIQNEKQQVINSLKIPVYAVLVLWLIKIAEVVFNFSLSSLGIYPRTIRGIAGIITAPLIHGGARGNDILGDFSHIFSNTMPLIVLGFIVLYSYRQIAAKLISIIWLGSGMMVWLAGRASYHIGASMLIYGLAFFVFFSGVFRKDTRSIALASIVVLFYGSMVWGLLPLERGVSWEGHIAGAIMGIATAYLYRGVNPRKRYDWEIEEEQLKKQPVETNLEDPFWVPKPIQTNRYTSDNILNWEVNYHLLESKKTDEPPKSE